MPDDSYEKVKKNNEAKKNSQEIFVKEAKAAYENAVKAGKAEDGRTFIPLKGE